MKLYMFYLVVICIAWFVFRSAVMFVFSVRILIFRAHFILLAL